jgi:ParB family transcriptional regulator, chromosome partitioning protein
MAESVLSKSVKNTMGAFEERVKSLGESEDKLASLKGYINKQVEIPVAYIRVEENVRRNLDARSHKFQELVESIRSQGVLQNLVVELRQEEGRFQLYCIAGQRRLLAAQEAGKAKVNCLIKEFENQADRIASGLTENLTREDLHCLDVAEGYAGLLEHGWTEEMISQFFERNPRTIRRYITIASWPREILDLLREHQEVITTKMIFNELVARRFSNTDEFKQAILSKVDRAKGEVTRPKATDAKLKQFEKSLKSSLKLKVSVSGDQQAGKITIAYASPEQLKQIKDLLLKEK